MVKKSIKESVAPNIGDSSFEELTGALLEVPIREGKEKKGDKQKPKKEKKENA